MLKGAPEIVLTKCSHYYQNKEEKAIDETFKDQMMGAYERCGFMGERVIGLSYKVGSWGRASWQR
jgi:magnesium-transporting ATPase (P-type)